MSLQEILDKDNEYCKLKIFFNFSYFIRNINRLIYS